MRGAAKPSGWGSGPHPSQETGLLGWAPEDKLRHRTNCDGSCGGAKLREEPRRSPGAQEAVSILRGLENLNHLLLSVNKQCASPVSLG